MRQLRAFDDYELDSRPSKLVQQSSGLIRNKSIPHSTISDSSYGWWKLKSRGKRPPTSIYFHVNPTHNSTHVVATLALLQLTIPVIECVLAATLTSTNGQTLCFLSRNTSLSKGRETGRQQNGKKISFPSTFCVDFSSLSLFISIWRVVISSLCCCKARERRKAESLNVNRCARRPLLTSIWVSHSSKITFCVVCCMLYVSAVRSKKMILQWH